MNVSRHDLGDGVARFTTEVLPWVSVWAGPGGVHVYGIAAVAAGTTPLSADDARGLAALLTAGAQYTDTHRA